MIQGEDGRGTMYSVDNVCTHMQHTVVKIVVVEDGIGLELMVMEC